MVLVGPAFSGPAKQASVVAEHEQIPMILFDATSPHLSGKPFMMRTCVSDQAYSEALLRIIEHFGWERFAVIHSQTEYGNGLKELLLVESEGSSATCTVNAAFSPDLDIVDEEIELALHSVEESHTRIVLLVAHSSDALKVLLQAASMGMSGKGWVWIGVGWGGDSLFNYLGSADEREVLRGALEGTLCLSAQKRSGSALDAALVAMAAAGTCYTPPTEGSKTCAGANKGVMRCDPEQESETLIAHREPMTDDIFDAVFLATYVLAHNSSLRSRSPPSSSALYHALLHAKNASSSSSGSGHRRQMSDSSAAAAAAAAAAIVSPNTKEPLVFWTEDAASLHSTVRRGDRTSHSLALYNMVCSKLDADGACVASEDGGHVAYAQVARFDFRAPTSSSEGHSDPASSSALVFDGSTRLYWPGGMLVTPSDRAPHSITTAAIYFLMLFVGMALAFVVEANLHAREVTWLPGSGATMLIGVLTGLLINGLGNEEMLSEAKFDEHFFTLFLLPIIVFESGYALRRSYFFEKIGAILAFAVAGTVIATLITGYFLHSVGPSCGVHWTLEEALAFAALISAVDPVATLVTFGSLKVEPQLNALVYGESIINDAVAIVIYKACVVFISEEVNPATIREHVMEKFLVIALGSLFFGAAFSIACTLLLKYAPMSHSPHAEALVIMLFAYSNYAVCEALELSGIVASVVAGICMNHFTSHNLSEAGKRTTKVVLRCFALLAETLIFLQVAVHHTLHSYTTHYTDTPHTTLIHHTLH
jgi:NhaP-type Na+/H+ or K+/H+ antiporter